MLTEDWSRRRSSLSPAPTSLLTAVTTAAMLLMDDLVVRLVATPADAEAVLIDEPTGLLACHSTH